MSDSQRSGRAERVEAKLAVFPEASTKCFDYAVEENDVLCGWSSLIM